MNIFVDDLFRRSDYFYQKNKSITNFIEIVIFSQSNFAKKSNSFVFYITVFIIQELNNETQMLLKKYNVKIFFKNISLSKESFEKQKNITKRTYRKKCSNSFYENRSTHVKEFYLKIFANHQKTCWKFDWNRINRNFKSWFDYNCWFPDWILHYNNDSTKNQFFCAKTMILCCSFNIDKTKWIQNNNNFSQLCYSKFKTKWCDKCE